MSTYMYNNTSALYMELQDTLIIDKEGTPFRGEIKIDKVTIRMEGVIPGLIDGGEGKPAIECGKHIEIWEKGKISRKREMGPAIYDYGKYTAEFWENGIKLERENYE